MSQREERSATRSIKHRSPRRRHLPYDDAILCLEGEVLLELHVRWQLEGRRMVSAESMASIPELGDGLTLQALNA